MGKNLTSYFEKHIEKRGRKPKAPKTSEELYHLQSVNAPTAYVRLLLLGKNLSLRKTNPKLFFEVNKYIYESYYGAPKVAQEPLEDRPYTVNLYLEEHDGKNNMAENRTEGTDDGGGGGVIIEEERLLPPAESSGTG